MISSLPEKFREQAQVASFVQQQLARKQDEATLLRVLNDAEVEVSQKNIVKVSSALLSRINLNEVYETLLRIEEPDLAAAGIRNVVASAFYAEPERTSQWIGGLKPGKGRDVAIAANIREMNPNREAEEIRAWTEAMSDNTLLRK